MKESKQEKTAGEYFVEQEKNNRKTKKDFCPVARKCGGCDYAGVPYAEQKKKKEQKVKDLLSSICPVRSIVGADDPFYYRNKVHWAFGHMGPHLIAGRYEEGSHWIIENDTCLLEDKECSKILLDIKNLAVKFKIQPFDERTRRGLLRRALIRKGMATKEVMVVLVLASPVFPGKKGFIKQLTEKHPSITTILININTRTDSMAARPSRNSEEVLSGMNSSVFVLRSLRNRFTRSITTRRRNSIRLRTKPRISKKVRRSWTRIAVSERSDFVPRQKRKACF